VSVKNLYERVPLELELELLLLLLSSESSSSPGTATAAGFCDVLETNASTHNNKHTVCYTI